MKNHNIIDYRRYAMGLQCGNIVALDTCGLRKQVDAAIKNPKAVKELDAYALEVFKAWKKRKEIFYKMV